MYLFERITIIGLGLIGSSLARAIRQQEMCATLVGCDEDESTLLYARAQQLVDMALADPAVAVSQSDLVILAVPPGAMGEVAKRMRPGMRKNAIVMDTASVKQPVIEAISRYLPANVDFIPAHPIAGSEQGGIAAGRADLFSGRRVVLTPAEPLQGRMLELMTRFWQQLGARVEGVPPQLHDVIYAHVSHLPQLLAFAARGIISAAPEREALVRFARLQSSPPELWTEIFLLSREPLLAALDRFMDALSHIQRELIDALETEASKDDAAHARDILLPRIIASCLVTTVMETEKKLGFALARFAGQGFKDFTAPASDLPEEDIERISHHYAVILPSLADYLSRLSTLRSLLAQEDRASLLTALK